MTNIEFVSPRDPPNLKLSKGLVSDQIGPPIDSRDKRVKSAAAVTGMPKRKKDVPVNAGEAFTSRITTKNFIKEGSLRKEHTQLMWRLDSGLEDIALRNEAKKRQEYLSRTTDKGVGADKCQCFVVDKE